MEITIKGTAKEVSQFVLETILPPTVKLYLRSKKGALTTISAKERNEAMRQQDHQASPSGKATFPIERVKEQISCVRKEGAIYDD